MQSPTVPEISLVVPVISESSVVAAQVVASYISPVASGLVSSGLCFSLDDRVDFAIIIRRCEVDDL